MGGNGKPRWIISFSRSYSLSPDSKKQKPVGTRDPPAEFICPVSGSLMSDPVVVSSGQTFERVSVQACVHLGFFPLLQTGCRPDFSAVIPNLALKSAIATWCRASRMDPPSSPDYATVEKIVRNKILDEAEGTGSGSIRFSEKDLLNGVAGFPTPVIHSPAVTELAHRVADRFSSGSSSEESVIVTTETPLPLKTRPCCFSSSSSSSEFFDFETLNPAQMHSLSSNVDPVEEEMVLKLRSFDVFEHEMAVNSLRNITKTRSDSRAMLCTLRLLNALKPLLVSWYDSVQVDATASVVNLSLEASNKVKIVRAGIVPYLIDVLKGGFSESQSHAAGALFSLALDEDNRMAIGALGALQPLLHALRSDTEQTRNDAALALYHLTLVTTNRVKLVKLNAVPYLLEMVKTGALSSRILLVLCNLSACPDGRTAMLDGHGIKVLVELLRENEGKKGSESMVENCVSAISALSQGNFRFKSLLKEAKGVELLRDVEKSGSQRVRERAGKLLDMLKGREDSKRRESVDWEAFLESG